MRKWLSRLAFSFFILGIVAAWEGRKVEQGGHNASVWYAACIALVILGFLGVRERHRKDRD